MTVSARDLHSLFVRQWIASYNNFQLSTPTRKGSVSIVTVQRGLRTYFFWKKTPEILGLLLCHRKFLKKYLKFHPTKLCKIVLHPWEISSPKNTSPHGNFTSFSWSPLEWFNGIILNDLQKAFGSINHILPKKMLLRFSSLINWFKALILNS